uniref:Uncharacterized protein n=1 Tax=Caenorhabditis japonica TaxID=281687 RepID=A0A8R1E6N6_CAEJA
MQLFRNLSAVGHVQFFKQSLLKKLSELQHFEYQVPMGKSTLTLTTLLRKVNKTLLCRKVLCRKVAL